MLATRIQILVRSEPYHSTYIFEHLLRTGSKDKSIQYSFNPYFLRIIQLELKFLGHLFINIACFYFVAVRKFLFCP